MYNMNTFSTYTHALLSHRTSTKHQFKDEIVYNFKMATVELRTKHDSPEPFCIYVYVYAQGTYP